MSLNNSSNKNFNLDNSKIENFLTNIQDWTPSVDRATEKKTILTFRQFIEEASRNLGFEIDWLGNGVNETGVDRKSGKTLIEVNEKYFRPAEVETLLGDASKAKALLGWEPKTSFEELVAEMCVSDLQWAKSRQ